MLDYSRTFAACDDGHVAWTGAAIKDDGFLNPGDEEVGPLTNNKILNTSKPVKYHGPVTCINCNKKDRVSHILCIWFENLFNMNYPDCSVCLFFKSKAILVLALSPILLTATYIISLSQHTGYNKQLKRGTMQKHHRLTKWVKRNPKCAVKISHHNITVFSKLKQSRLARLQTILASNQAISAFSALHILALLDHVLQCWHRESHQVIHLTDWDLPLNRAEFTTPPPMARAIPNFPMDSNNLAMTATWWQGRHFETLHTHHHLNTYAMHYNPATVLGNPG